MGRPARICILVGVRAGGFDTLVDLGATAVKTVVKPGPLATAVITAVETVALEGVVATKV